MLQAISNLFKRNFDLSYNDKYNNPDKKKRENSLSHFPSMIIPK